MVAIERLGGEVCGFTMPREAKLCAELGIPFAALLVATNWAAGKHPGDQTKALRHDDFLQCALQREGILLSCIVDLLKNSIRDAAAHHASSPKRKLVDGWSEHFIKRARNAHAELELDGQGTANGHGATNPNGHVAVKEGAPSA